MSPYTLRFIPALTAVVFGILLLMPQFSHGEDAATALAQYERFIPGSPMPNGLDCDGATGFYDNIQVLCRVEGGQYCQHGYIVVRHSVIVHTTFFRCNFPVAYLVAQYGRYEQVRRYRRALVLRWPHAYAHVRRTGWLNSMQSVYIVTWWRATESSDRVSF